MKQQDKPKRAVDVAMVGPFPPPVHGQAVVTQQLYKMLEETGLVVRPIDAGEGAGRFHKFVRRGWNSVCGLVNALKPARTLYLSVNASGGLYLTALFAIIGRVSGKRIVLHHHVYRYIGAYDRRMAFIANIAGSDDAVHVTNCDAMAAELAMRYPVIKHAIGFGNATSVDAQLLDLPRPRSGHVIRLGHMSNLNEVKGVGRAIALFRRAREAGLPVEMSIAGPFADAFAEEVVGKAQEEFQGAFTYLGPVHGEAKRQFFGSIDIFVFPTLYVNEAGPLVNLEAMAAGVPVISIAQCCIPSTLEGGGGVAIDRNADFVESGLEFVREFQRNRETMPFAARDRYKELAAGHASEMQRFIAALR